MLCFSNVKKAGHPHKTRVTQGGNIGGLEGVLMTAVWDHAFENAVMCVIQPPTQIKGLIFHTP